MTKDTKKSGTTKKKTGSSSGKRTQTSSAKRSKAAARKKKKQKKIIFTIEAIVIVILLIALFVMKKFDKLDNSVDIKEGEIKTNEDRTVSHDTDNGYTNIALFGIDSRENNTFGAGNHSDALMVASINNSTGDVKIVSVYRDTYLNLSDDKYRKATEAYFFGGPSQAINMLNMNLDLDITKYVAVDFNALVKTIDLLGGLEIELTGEEIHHLNNYTVETSAVTGVKTEWLDEDKPGTYLLDGVQAVSYSRIRYTSGADFKRTERQRQVIELIAQKAKKASLTTLNSIINEVLPYVSTNLTPTEILSMAADIAKYNIADTTGFPFDKTTMDVSSKGNCVVPVTLESNVIQLYEFLFGETDYKPSSTVQNISKKVISDTGVSSLN